MFSFMLGVLGSTVFWVLFFAVDFVIGSILLRYMAPETYKLVTEGSEDFDVWNEDLSWVFILIFAYVLWPFWVV